MLGHNRSRSDQRTFADGDATEDGCIRSDRRAALDQRALDRPIRIGGSKKMITYDDLEPSEKIKIYDKGVSFTEDPQKIQERRVGYRTGDMWAPKLAVTEALSIECEHFVDCIANNKVSKTDGFLGLRVVEIIEAANQSMRHRGETVDIQSGSNAS